VLSPPPELILWHLPDRHCRNHQLHRKPRRSDPTSSPPSLSDGGLPQKAFQSQSLNRAKTPYPGSLIESFAGDYRRWSRIEQIVSPAFLITALGGVASMFTPLLGG
jgi:hypothetical protein